MTAVGSHVVAEHRCNHLIRISRCVIKEMIQRLQREHRVGTGFHPITNRAD